MDVLPAMILLGLGIGGSFPALMTLAMSGATREDAGLASGLVNTAAQVGGALGLAVLATLSATRTKHLLASGKSNVEALTGGYHLAFVISAVLMVLSIAVAALALKAKAPSGDGVLDRAEELDLDADDVAGGEELSGLEAETYA